MAKAKFSPQFLDQLKSSVSNEGAQRNLEYYLTTQLAALYFNLRQAPDWDTARKIQGEIDAYEKMKQYLLRSAK